MPEYPVALLALLQLFRQDVQQITYQLEQKQITLDDWKSQMIQLLMRYSTAVMMLGLNVEVMTEQAEAAILAQVTSQLPYLENFANDIAAGLVDEATMGAWLQKWDDRAGMYTDSIIPLFWKGSTRFLELPAYPADGSAPCLFNDRCMWWLDWISEENIDVDAYWLTEKDQKVCLTCAERGERWYPLQVRGGVVPKNV